ncbi:hypothetical protein [Mycolicibacterium gadium]|uniref:DUF7255 family protein n=1 Tax=Mycolicibacterium gadium TaxID=1794 RepID=UPI002FDC9BC6
MVSPGPRANALQGLMVEAGFRATAAAPPPPRLDALHASARDRVAELFKALSERTSMPSLRPGAWDLAFDGGLVVELDEELHFNRYRARTLQRPWATDLPWHDSYLMHCRDQEPECLAAGKWGKRWTNPSCESMFGPPDRPGRLDRTGSPRWKQRALYDAVKDVAALQSTTLRLCRLSVWDRIGDTSIGDALAGAAVEPAVLSEFIELRTI